MLQENQLFANRYRLVKRLGQGAFSEVWKAEDTETGNLTVALKVYAPDKGLDEDGAKIFSEEFAIVFNVHHSNLLTPTYYAKESNSPYLVLPFCEQGSSTRLIGKMSEQQVAQFLHDVSSALAYLHAKDIIHQDIKPDNVLIDGEGNYMVTDFGISTRIRSTLRKSVGDKKSSGTMAYMGPERFSRTPQTIKASDVWSLGATVYELMSGYPPFNDFGGLSQKGGADIPEVEGSYSGDMKKLVERCIAKETWDRPTAAQLRDISEGYLRTGVWNLSLLNGDSPKEPEPPKQAEKPSRRETERMVRTELAAETIPQPEKHSQSPKPSDKKGSKRSKILMWVTGVTMAVYLCLLLDTYFFYGILSWKILSIVVSSITFFIVVNIAYLLQLRQVKAKWLLGITSSILLTVQIICCHNLAYGILYEYVFPLFILPIITSAWGIEGFVFAKQYGRIRWVNMLLSLTIIFIVSFIYWGRFIPFLHLGIISTISHLVTIIIVLSVYVLLFRYIKKIENWND